MANYNTTLQSNNIDLQSILDTVNSLPEASGGNSSSVDTCTVEISMSAGKKAYATVIDENGNIAFNEVVSVDSDGGSSNSSGALSGEKAIIENVVCNSFIYCNINLRGIPITGTATLFAYGDKESWSLFKSPSVAGEYCIISW